MALINIEMINFKINHHTLPVPDRTVLKRTQTYRTALKRTLRVLEAYSKRTWSVLKAFSKRTQSVLLAYLKRTLSVL